MKFLHLLKYIHAVFPKTDLHSQASQDLHARLEAALEQVDTFQHLLQERDAEQTELEQMIREVQKESREVQKALEESVGDSCRYHCSLKLISRYTSIKARLLFVTIVL